MAGLTPFRYNISSDQSLEEDDVEILDRATPALHQDYLDFTAHQLSVSTLAQHHMLVVAYPDSGARPDPHVTREWAFPVPGFTIRYEPAPLVESAAHKATTGWDDTGLTRFPIYFPSTRTWMVAGDVPGMVAPEGDLAQMVHELDWAMDRAGRTGIGVVTFYDDTSVDANGEAYIMLAFRVQTIFSLPALPGFGAPPLMPITERRFIVGVERFHNLKPRPIWWYAVYDLLHRFTDRAQRHVQQRGHAALAHHFAKHTWRRHRYADLEAFLAPRVVALGDVDPMAYPACPVCAEEPDHPFYAPVRLQCEHLICKTCVQDLCRGVLSEAPVCPMCRTALFDPQQLRTVQMRSVGRTAPDGSFRFDRRFTRWENWERSCSDLDNRHASNLHGPDYRISVRPKHLIAAWNLCLVSARRESVLSTSRHYQHAHCHEAGIARFAFAFAARHDGVLDFAFQTGVKTSVDAIFNSLTQSLWRALHSIARATNLAPHIATLVPVNPMDVGKVEVRRFLRPGLVEFLELMVHRALMIVLKRGCGDAAHAGRDTMGVIGLQPGWHRHGDRMFYCGW